MESTLTRNEKIFITLTFGFIAAFLVFFGKLNKKPTDLSHYAVAEVINYQMARAEEGFAGYSLDGREIDEQYQGLEAKKAKATAKLLKAVAKAPVKSAAKAAVQIKKATATQQNVSVTTTSTISSNTSPSASAFSQNKSTKSTSINDNSSAPQANNIAQNPDTATTPSIENTLAKPKEKKSYSQWRQEIFAKASKEAVSEFIAAYRRSEVTATEYQAMAQDLLEQSDANLKGLGLMALRSQPSMASLSQLVHVQEAEAAPLQAYIEQAYLAYVQPQNIQYLNQALQTQDRKLVLKSLSLLSVNIPKIKNGDVSALVDSRHLRATDTNDLSLGSFKQLLPSLTFIGSAQVPDISPLAQQVAAMIQSTQVAGL